MKSAITTHILDVQRGMPAAGITVELYQWQNAAEHGQNAGYEKVAAGTTDDDGRITDWLGDKPREAGLYEVIFYTEHYFKALGETTLYPKVCIEFYVTDTKAHYHIPLLLSANGYTTYRGS